MRLKILLIGCLLLISGCTTTKTEYIEKPVYHPNRPIPVKTYVPKWEVLIIKDTPMVGMSYDESINFRLWLERLLAYINKQNEIICSYREDLKETECIEKGK